MNKNTAQIPPHLPDRLVRLLKERGLAHRIAFVEVLNEAYYVETAETWMGKARDFARERGLPLVLDEGVAFWPPANTRLYGDAIAQRHEAIVAEIAIRDGYWGIMPTGYVAPYFQNWNDPAVIAWLQRVNAKILGKGL